jgi:DNA-binding NarL/FixJ family response regulator
MKIRVAIVEDDLPFGQMLEELINETSDCDCVAAFTDPRAALKQLMASSPDVVLMDLQLPHMNGIECVAALRQKLPDIRVIMLTVFEQDDQVFSALSAGAYGYLVKRTAPAGILDAIREVHEGGSPMSAHIARRVVASFHQSTTATLSTQERDVLVRLSHGQTYGSIAVEMGISIHTVRSYIRRIYEKLQVHSRTEAVAKFKNM